MLMTAPSSPRSATPGQRSAPLDRLAFHPALDLAFRRRLRSDANQAYPAVASTHTMAGQMIQPFRTSGIGDQLPRAIPRPGQLPASWCSEKTSRPSR